jgi:hypothetical protein
MNLQIEVADVNPLYADVQQADLSVIIPLKERWLRQDQNEAGNRQFVMADPDGYLLRFFSDLGQRPAEEAWDEALFPAARPRSELPVA